jgi:hypothetical protein
MDPLSLLGIKTPFPIPEIEGNFQWLERQTTLQLDALEKFKGRKTLEERLKDKMLPQLTELNLTCSSYTPNLDYHFDLLPLLEKSKQLTCLNLTYWTYLTDENIKEIIGKCPQEKLETLILYNCSNLTVEIAYFLLDKCPNLKRVVLYGCREINRNNLQDRCQAHPNYREGLFETGYGLTSKAKAGTLLPDL